MHRSGIFKICLVAVLAIVMLTTSASAQKDGNSRMSVTVSFGAGLNTNQFGNAANHHVLPNTIEVKEGGVGNFVVAGFHNIFVYKPHVRLEDIQALEPTTMGTFINVAISDLLYQGINPAAPPPAGVSNAVNRVESVSFAEQGTYLVICNVRDHFLDGMYAIVKVTG